MSDTATKSRVLLTIAVDVEKMNEGMRSNPEKEAVVFAASICNILNAENDGHKPSKYNEICLSTYFGAQVIQVQKCDE